MMNTYKYKQERMKEEETKIQLEGLENEVKSTVLNLSNNIIGFIKYIEV